METMTDLERKASEEVGGHSIERGSGGGPTIVFEVEALRVRYGSKQASEGCGHADLQEPSDRLHRALRMRQEARSSGASTG